MRTLPGFQLARIVLIGLCVLAVQRTVAAQHRIDDVAIQLMLTLSAAAGAAGGTGKGAFAGFVWGMMSDLAFGTPLGVTALCYALAGAAAGYVITITPDPQWWLAAGFVLLGVAIGEAALPAAIFLTGQEGVLGRAVIRVVPIVAGAGLVLAPLFIPLGRWCVGVTRPKWKAMLE